MAFFPSSMLMAGSNGSMLFTRPFPLPSPLEGSGNQTRIHLVHLDINTLIRNRQSMGYAVVVQDTKLSPHG